MQGPIPIEKLECLFALLTPDGFKKPTACVASGRPTLFTLDQIKDYIDIHRFVKLMAFTLMPNHFHLAVFNLTSSGLAQYMHKVITAYTKYINAKYGRSGHLFQGSYQRVRVDSDDQLAYLSAYIHRNQRDLPGWCDREQDYPWSSYLDYVSENRFDLLLDTAPILELSRSRADYHEYVKKSGAKDRAPSELLIDLDFAPI